MNNTRLGQRMFIIRQGSDISCLTFSLVNTTGNALAAAAQVVPSIQFTRAPNSSAAPPGPNVTPCNVRHKARARPSGC